MIITELFRVGAERYAKKIVQVLCCNDSDIEIIRDRLKSVTSCSVIELENSSRILENQRSLKMWVRIEKKGGR